MKLKALATIKSNLLRSGHLQAFLAEDLLHATQEVRHFDGDDRLGGQKTGNDTLAFCDLDLFPVAEEFLDCGEAVTQFANRCFLHLTYLSIANHSE
jgi:hypothetical protein